MTGCKPVSTPSATTKLDNDAGPVVSDVTHDCSLNESPTVEPGLKSIGANLEELGSHANVTRVQWWSLLKGLARVGVDGRQGSCFPFGESLLQVFCSATGRKEKKRKGFFDDPPRLAIVQNTLPKTTEDGGVGGERRCERAATILWVFILFR
ncbi:hypothetical protein NE237_001886 [Protea cynaroides]|uniref:Uncharacterized protein n=1 Tax=Protea cynaroides TaxID=273540 RepID=A0A9Q0QYI7_9MAGN|nr:hypothetical protein NE237_001886 [Protea cynaroides]